jgi:hypothetical protein
VAANTNAKKINNANAVFGCCISNAASESSVCGGAVYDTRLSIVTAEGGEIFGC